MRHAHQPQIGASSAAEVVVAAGAGALPAPLESFGRHAAAEEFRAFIHAFTPAPAYRKRLRLTYQHFVARYPDIGQWFAAPLPERVGVLHGDPVHRPTFPVSGQARVYLEFLAFRGFIRLDWEWLIAVGRLYCRHVLGALGAVLETEDLAARGIMLGYARKTVEPAIRLTLTRLLLHAGTPHLAQISDLDATLGAYEEALIRFRDHPDVARFFGSRDRYWTNAADAARSSAHALRVILYHERYPVQEPVRHKRRTPLPPATPRMQAVIDRYLARRRFVDAESTVCNLRKALRHLTGWLAQSHPEIASFAEVTRADMLEFLTALASEPSVLSGRRLSVVSRAHLVSMLAMFFREVAEWGWWRAGHVGHVGHVGGNDAFEPKEPDSISTNHPGNRGDRHRHDPSGPGEMAAATGEPVGAGVGRAELAEGAEVPRYPPLYASDRPKLPEALPRYLSEDELVRLMPAVRALPCPYQRAALLVARWSGARGDEIRRLEVDCLTVDADGKYTLRIPAGKNYQERAIPLHREAAEAVRVVRALRAAEQTVALRDPRTGVSTHYLFLRHGQRLSRNYLLEDPLHDACHAAGLLTPDGLPTVSAHRLRHTVGTQLARRRAQMRTIMAVLGHKSSQMTLRYIGITDAEVRAEYDAALEQPRLAAAADDARTDLLAGPAALRLQALQLTAADIAWLKAHFFQEELELGNCFRLPEEGPCECDLYLFCSRFVTTRDKAPRLRERRRAERDLVRQAQAHGWESEVRRHERLAQRCAELLTQLGEPLNGVDVMDEVAPPASHP